MVIGCWLRAVGGCDRWDIREEDKIGAGRSVEVSAGREAGEGLE